jgi:DNA-binding MarR family transcriptional regulator
MISRYEVFSAAVSSMYHDIQKIERVEMAKFGLKGPHAQCLLAMLRYSEGVTAARLCEICDKDKAAISRTLAELEEAGMIGRKEQNGSRYRALLTLTEQGMSAAEAVSRRAQVAVEQAGQGLDDSQRQIFYRVLALISGNLHTICKDGLTK